MNTILTIYRHSLENCPGLNEKAGKAQKELFDKLPELLKKHGVKLIGGWSVTSEHSAVGVFEISSMEAFEKLGNEPEMDAMGAFNTNEFGGSQLRRNTENAAASQITFCLNKTQTPFLCVY